MNTSIPTVSTHQTFRGLPTKRQQLASILLDGRSHSIESLSQRLNSPIYALRGRMSELRTNNGFIISHENGRAQLIGIQI